MSISAKSVRFDEDSFWGDLSDGRTLGVPLAWFPRLLDASPEQREAIEVGGAGLHWEALDEDISIAGLLAGRGDRARLGRERWRAAGKSGAAWGGSPMDTRGYAVVIEALSAADGGGYLATVPDLPGCTSDGQTREEAARNVEDAIACWLEECRELGREIPLRSPRPKTA